MNNSEYRQPTHREELERELVHGASSQIAHAPENAAAIAKGIKTVLDELAPVAPHPVAIAPLHALDHGTAYIESEIQANSHHSGCKGERCMASAANGYAHSRECIDEAGEAQGWTPTAEDYAKCGPSAGCCGAACASPENFDAEIGRKIARQNAIEKIWPLVGYELRTKLAGSKA